MTSLLDEADGASDGLSPENKPVNKQVDNLFEIAELVGVAKILNILWDNSYYSMGKEASKRIESEMIYYFGENWSLDMYNFILRDGVSKPSLHPVAVKPLSHHKHIQGNDMADERPDDPQNLSNPPKGPTPPQPNTGDERLKELIRNLPKTVWPTDSNYPNWWKVDIDEVISAVKAELGAAIGKDVIEESDDTGKYKVNKYLVAENRLRRELRNHFGIGGDV